MRCILRHRRSAPNALASWCRFIAIILPCSFAAMHKRTNFEVRSNGAVGRAHRRAEIRRIRFPPFFISSSTVFFSPSARSPLAIDSQKASGRLSRIQFIALSRHASVWPMAFCFRITARQPGQLDVGLIRLISSLSIRNRLVLGIFASSRVVSRDSISGRITRCRPW